MAACRRAGPVLLTIIPCAIVEEGSGPSGLKIVTFYNGIGLVPLLGELTFVGNSE